MQVLDGGGPWHHLDRQRREDCLREGSMPSMQLRTVSGTGVDSQVGPGLGGEKGVTQLYITV